jgi:hypothetical protein
MSASATLARADLPATIDVATGGRLLGVELRFAGSSLDATTALRLLSSDPRTAPHVTVDDDGAAAYIELTSGIDGDVRSALATVTVEMTGDAITAVIIPRSGHGYEISYPSGNR